MQKYQEVKQIFPLNTVLMFEDLCLYRHEDLIYFFPRSKLSLLQPHTFLWLDTLRAMSILTLGVHLWDPGIETTKDLKTFIKKVV